MIAKVSTKQLGMNIKAAGNSTYKKLAVQWLYQALCFYQSFFFFFNEVLRNPRLRKAAKRYAQLHRLLETDISCDWNFKFIDKDKKNLTI